MQFLGDILEVDDGIDVERGFCLFWQNVLTDVFLETASELRDVLNLQRETYGISVTTEVLKQVATGS